jgi:hypothetical protein
MLWLSCHTTPTVAIKDPLHMYANSSWGPARRATDASEPRSSSHSFLINLGRCGLQLKL